jgi:glycosyltransferase involved in cell wall biosynthesis
MRRALRILQVNYSDLGGGAERVAADLFRRYGARGHDSWLAVSRRLTDDGQVVTIPNEARRSAWARFWNRKGERVRAQAGGQLPRVLAGGLKAVGEPLRALKVLGGREDFDFPGTRELLALTPAPPDIVHGHNLVEKFFDLRALAWLSRRVPVVLTLHDQWLFTGHCVYSMGCGRWEGRCGSCPDLKIYPAVRRDATAGNWRRKAEIYRQSRVYVASPSRWLMEQARRSMLRPAIIESRVIPNGVDLSAFSPGDRGAARRRLGLPLDARIALFVANKARSNQFKDYATVERAVLKAAQGARRGQNLFLCVGEAAGRAGDDAAVRFVGYEKNPARLADYYRAADVFIHAARADNFPTTILEAMACGLPVIATEVGGIGEQVTDSVTGFLVPAGDSEAIAARLKLVLNDASLRDNLGARAAAEARARFDLERQADAYLDWYEEILKSGDEHSALRGEG